jgi:RNA methyltransferase, TrmH family
MLITSKDNSRVKEMRKLLNSKYSKEKGEFIVEGENLIEEAIKNNLLTELYVLDGEECKYDFPYNNLSFDVMKSISDLKSTPRLIGVCKYRKRCDLGNRIVILDDIQDPGNAGTIIRNCVAFDVDSVVFSLNSVNPYSEKVLRSTGGMIFNTNVIISDLKSIIGEIKSNGINVIGTSLNSSVSLECSVKSDKYAVIFGNEGNGVHKNILDLCDEIVRIDMNSKCESLNVGVSSGIILYYLFKR